MAKRASAKRYAQATFDIALQRDQLDQWASDLGLVVEALQNEEFSAFLEHAKVPLAQKVQTIGEAFQGVDPMVRNLVSLLVSRGLAELVPEVEEGYRGATGPTQGQGEGGRIFGSAPGRLGTGADYPGPHPADKQGSGA